MLKTWDIGRGTWAIDPMTAIIKTTLVRFPGKDNEPPLKRSLKREMPKKIQGTEAIPSVLLGLPFVTVALVTIHRLLYSEKAKDYFNQKSEPSGGINSVRSTHFVDTP
jgi:hypothetical protein